MSADLRRPHVLLEPADARTHVYLSQAERAELEAFATDYASSLSYVMRIALRLLVGLSVPREFEHFERGKAR